MQLSKEDKINKINKDHSQKNKALIKKYSSSQVLSYAEDNCNIQHSTIVVPKKDNNNRIIKINHISDNIIILKRINDIRYINKFFESANKNLLVGGKLLCCLETFHDRKKRKWVNNIPILRNLYFFIEYFLLRFFPKTKILKNVYFGITKGRKRLLSQAECLGRLICCGFEIRDFKKINNLMYIVAEKKIIPKFDMNPSYGMIYKMPRVGKESQIINYYKLRTMHPYSEYLQDFMFKNHGSGNGDKIHNDFRITPSGSFLRKFWIDEIPMLINFFRGEIKLVGVRPLSKSKFNMYPQEAKKLRIKYKPGLIPPFYSDLPTSFEELVDSEIQYLKQYEKNPWRTDLKYFFQAMNNIIFKSARSK